MTDLVIAGLLFLLWLLWSKNRRLQQRLSVFEAAETHFCQGEFPLNLKMLEGLQKQVGDLFSKEDWRSDSYQEVFNLWIGVSKLINYWCALHPSEVADSLVKHNEEALRAAPHVTN